MAEEQEIEHKPHIIIDNGTGYCKAGLSGEDGPRAVFPSCVGYPKYYSGMVGGDKKEYFVGADAEAKRKVLKLNHPIDRGIVNNRDDMEKIWGHIFTNELKVAPEEHNVMLTEAIMNPKENKEKMAQIMFETFNVPGLYIALQPSLVLYASGEFTGIVLELGEGVSQFCPIYAGYSLYYAIERIDFGGKDLSDFMAKILVDTGKRFTTVGEKMIAKTIKEKTCYVALDFQDEIKYVEPFDYELPDGTHLIIKDQRIRCPEILFQSENNIAQKCYDSIQKCDFDVRKDFYNCIVLSGGSSMFNGLPERLTKEIKCLAPESMKEEVKVIASPERKFFTWIGGSILSTISTFESMWVTKTEYEESGAAIVHKKFF